MSSETKPLWKPCDEFKASSNLAAYMAWLAERGHRFESYNSLWRWSVEDLPAFWSSIVEYFDVRLSRPASAVLGRRTMPGAEWFVGAQLNYAENVFRHAREDRPALVHASESSGPMELSWSELRRQVTSLAATLRELGVQRGDRVVSYMPNLPQTVTAFLACASLGAIWSSCSPDFGRGSVVDRFTQIDPKVLLAVDGYVYGGKEFDRREVVEDIRRALPSLQTVIAVPNLRAEAPRFSGHTLSWQEAIGRPAGELTFEPVPFDHPLWVVYSSGTTGLPKPIVHGHGGVVLEHAKFQALHLDAKPEDRMLWYTSTGWIMWNLAVMGPMVVGAVPVLYDGNPGYPDLDVLWKLVVKAGITAFGSSAAFLTSCMRAGLEPGKTHDLSRLKMLGSTGSPLPEDAFAWAYEHVKEDVWLVSNSGGTDVATAFVGGVPLLPLYAGELQAPLLGVRVESFDPLGRPLVGSVGELVVTEPMPSMPLFFWNDEGDRRYREAYFDMYPGVWRHGDWIEFTARGSSIIHGRSDSTLNRQGVRMGSSEIYSVVETLPEIADSLVVGIELPDGGYYMPLFISLNPGFTPNDELRAKIRNALRTSRSPRHVPDDIVAVEVIPRTLTGKKLEVPMKKLLMGQSVDQALSLDATADPAAVPVFVELARHLEPLRQFSASRPAVTET